MSTVSTAIPPGLPRELFWDADAGALDLLTSLSAHPVLSAFSLAGGTSLALRFGHRLSEVKPWILLAWRPDFA